MRIFKLYFLIFVSCLSYNSFSQGLIITSAGSPASLINNIIGTGISASNFSGQINSCSGSFTNAGGSGLTYPSGIILTTGNTVTTASINSASSILNDGTLNLPGDSNLDSVILPLSTQDAQSIEFDFECSSDSAQFEFVFASEEYNDFVNSFHSDRFAVFITGPGYLPNTNIATLFGSGIPISINSVNNGYATGTSTGPCMNCDYYIDNVNGNAFNLVYDGFISLLNLRFKVQVCETYHIKIVVADVFDDNYDSALILKGQSFTAYGQPTILVNGNYAGSNINICQGGNVTLTSISPFNNLWSTGDTTQSITITQPGTYSYAIFNGSCFAFSQSLIVNSSGTIQTPVIVQNGSSLLAPNILPSPTISYKWKLNGVLIPGATQSTLLIPGNGCYTLTIYEGLCSSTSNIICITNTSVNNISKENFNIFPNPVKNTATITTPFSNHSVSTITITDITGRTVLKNRQTGNKLTINKNNLVSGIYLVHISNEELNATTTLKIIIE